MKNIFLGTLLALSSVTAYSQDLVSESLDQYLNANQSMNSYTQSLAHNYTNGRTDRIEVINLHAYLDLSHLDPAIVKMLEAQFQAAQRLNRLREFWSSFHMGTMAAENLLSDNGGNPRTCELVKAISATGTDKFTKEAFSLGIKVRAPFCFVKDYFVKIQKIAQDLNDLKKGLFQVKLKVANMNLDEEQTIALYNEVVAETKKAYLAELDKASLTLKEGLNLDEEALAKVVSSAKDLSDYIGCPTLQSRLGVTFFCDVKVAPAAATLKTGDAYQILFQGKETGAFESQILVNSLINAAIVFKTEIRPTDFLVDYLVSMLKVNLQNLQALKEIKIAKSIEISKRNLGDNFDAMKAAQVVALRKLLSNGLKEKLLSDLFAFKLALEDYKMFSASRFDARIMAQLQAQYNDVLNLYGLISLKLELGNKDILLDLGAGFSLIHLTLASSSIGPVYLLGQNHTEIQDWLNFLAIE
ncbi:MAG: hypothetical protein ACOYL6_16755 [Bacteriovoracaceae bacterium]